MKEVENLILRKQQLEENLVELINKSGLPAFVISPILKELCTQTIMQEQQQLDLAMQRKKEAEAKKAEAKEEKNERNN